MSSMEFLSLDPDDARTVGALVLLGILLLDLVASVDEVPGNTPREWIIRLTQWKSRWKFLPLTGAIIPFMFGVLVGHFFHPWEQPPLGIDGYLGLAMVFVMGGLVSWTTYYRPSGRGVPPVFLIAVLGGVAGLFLWPVFVVPPTG